jgi:hypothetical protein
MAVLRPLIIPSLGLPTQVVAPARKRPNMAQPNFFQQQAQQSQQNQPQSQEDLIKGLQRVSDSTYKPQNEQFDQSPMTGDYISQQLASYQNRQSVPQLQPGARVQAPDEQLANPANFQSFYDRLSSITGMGNEMLGAAQARNAFARMQQLNAINSQGVQAPNAAVGNFGSAKGSIPSNPKANFSFAQQIGPQFGWGPDELAAWYTLGMKESGWNNNAQNPTSTAYGIGQFLDSTWKGVGGSKTSDPRLQVQYMAQYIKNRYGSPSRALAFHNAHNWY